MPRTAQEFGDEHTKKKLETVQKYLSVYTTALKYSPFKLLYVDACAGSGSSVPKSALEQSNPNQVSLDGLASPVADTDAIIVGSAIRVLGVNPAFHRYLLNDVKQTNVNALRKAIREDFPHLADRVELTRLDANEMLRNLCRSHNWNETRAVVFIDPFGLQIDYQTLELLGETKAVDVWYLVPVFAMYRQVSGDGQIHPDGGPRVDAALGTTVWRDVAVVEEETTDLFKQPQFRSTRAVDIAWFEKVGTSIENAEVIERAQHLARIVGATLFISFEPLIGRIPDIDLRKIHWAIIGGESGPRARPMDPEWVDHLHEICRRDDVAFFFKQWGGQNKKAAGRELHGRTYDEFPLALDV